MRILIVEDEPKIANSIKKGLVQERYSVDITTDGDAGLSAGMSDDYDLIILDWMLPGSVDGYQICKQLRAEGVRTPILMLTAKGTIGNKVSGLNAGADDYLAKPYSFDELLARVRALLRRPSSLVHTKMSIEGLELDGSRAMVKRGGKNIRLTSKEFTLLEYLMRHHGRIVSKEQLIQHVWDDEADILTNTVEVYMNHLRKKIDKPFHDALIHTVRGFGYRLGSS